MKYAHLLDADNKVTQISMVNDTDTEQDCAAVYGVQTIVCDEPAGIGYTYDAQTKTFVAPATVVVYVPPVDSVSGFAGTLA